MGSVFLNLSALDKQLSPGYSRIIELNDSTMTQLNATSTNYSSSKHYSSLPKDDRIIPTVNDILKFGRSIGISNFTIKPGYEKWWNILHEIGHFAVKPDSYIEMWRKHGAPDGIPNLNWFSGNEVIKPEDPTPDEWGVRAWCLSVLDLMGWINPIDCPDWPAANDWDGRETNNPYLWMKSETISRRHPLHKNGYKQLEIMGIDFSHGILRPTKEIILIGWQPVLGWRFLESA